MVVTGATPEQLNDPSLPTWFEFTQQLADIINRWAPATWTGFNSITFDEEFFRQSFYQNLHPNLYLTQFNGNNRLDMMKAIYATYSLAQEALEWPLNDKGQISFKLDQLAPANGYTEHDAHDALGDVEATIYIAKLIRDRVPEVWAECLRNRDKHDVNALLESGKPLQLIDRFGAAPPRSYIGCFAGRNPDNPNSVGFFDLELTDPEVLAGEVDSMLAIAVSGTPKLIRTVSVNKCPSLFEVEGVMPEMVKRAEFISNNSNFRARIGIALARRFADREEPMHVEQQIYAGFYINSDRQLLEQFQKVGWEDRYNLIDRFDDARLRQLAKRVLFLHKPELLPDTLREAMQSAIRDRWMMNDPNVPWTTHHDADEQLEEIEKQQAVDSIELARLIDYFRQFKKTITAPPLLR